MPATTRRIGLSLGADLCWPLAFEKLLADLDLKIELGGESLRFECERVTIEPYDLQQPTRYDVVLDRVTHWYATSREWIKKAILLDGTYVLNNPWAIQSMEKQTTYCAMMRLGLPVPATWMVPPKEYAESDDLQPTLRRYARFFDLGKVGEELGYPMFMKPYDGGAWKGVSRIDDEASLRAAYEQSGRNLMHLQKAVDPFEAFIRCIGVGPQLRPVLYDPSAALHDRYQTTPAALSDDSRALIENMTLTINAFFGWDFNSCEALLKDNVWQPIDFANACPDSQATSLHQHWPWLVLAKLRWSLYCAATKRKMRTSLDWDSYFDLADETEGAPLAERLQAYGDLSRKRLDADDFASFCDTHLGGLDSLADAYFQSDHCHDALRQKVTSLFPEHEIEEFTELFWQRIQSWRTTELTPRLAGNTNTKNDTATGAAGA